MYFSELNALLLHPAKTAGTSVEKLLLHDVLDDNQYSQERLFGWNKEKGFYLQHATAAAARDELGSQIFDSAYRFATVRNPYGRIVSVYHYLFPQHEARFGGFRPFVLQLPQLVKKRSSLLGNRYSPQYRFVTIEDKPIFHRLIRFEYIDEDFEQVTLDLGISVKLQNLYEYRHSSYPVEPTKELYDGDMIEAMQIAYSDDFRFFKYPAEPE